MRAQALCDLLGDAGVQLHLDNDQANAALLVLGAALTLVRAVNIQVRAPARADGNMEDVDGHIDAEDRVWRQLIEEGDEQRRAELFALSKEQRKAVIEAAPRKYPDRLTRGD